MERLEPNHFGSGSSCSDAVSLDVDVDAVREVAIVARVDDLASSKRKHFSLLHNLLCHAHHYDEIVDCSRLK